MQTSLSLQPDVLKPKSVVSMLLGRDLCVVWDLPSTYAVVVVFDRSKLCALRDLINFLAQRLSAAQKQGLALVS